MASQSIHALSFPGGTASDVRISHSLSGRTGTSSRTVPVPPRPVVPALWPERRSVGSSRERMNDPVEIQMIALRPDGNQSERLLKK